MNKESVNTSEASQPKNISLIEALEKQAANIYGKEMNGRGRKFEERGFDCYGMPEIFDFIKVDDSRLIMVLYSQRKTNHYHPRYVCYEGWDFYPMGFSEEEIRDVFHSDLEQSKLPKPASHQIAMLDDGNYYTVYKPLCIEIKDKNNIREIEELVEKAANSGIRKNIISKKSEDVSAILGRIENDDSLDFNYIDSSGRWIFE